jgi:hypothetical protein
MKRQDRGMTGSPSRLVRFWFTKAYIFLSADDEGKMDNR